MSQPWQPPGHQPPQQPASGQWPSQADPTQGYHPQQGAYPQQPQPAPGYPPQPYPVQQYPGQQYPGQPYPGQPYPGAMPGQPYPGAPMPGQFPPGMTASGPLTSAGWGAIPAILGVVASAIGLLVLPWVSVSGVTLSFLDLTSMPTENLFTLPDMYVAWLAFVVLALQPLYPLLWTLGAIRTQKAANLVQGWPRTQLTHATFTGFRIRFGVSAFMCVLLHGLGILTLYEGQFDVAGAGPWVVLGGAILTTVGTVIGSRKGPGLPPA
jgi:hypothetical protein